MSRRTLIASCGAHSIQDGMVALQYVLLPILAQQFSLSYAQVGFLRAVGHTAMTTLEIPSGVLSERFGERRLLVFGLLCVGAGYLGIAYSATFIGIALCLLLAGGGAAFQHSLSSAIIARSFGDAERRHALGTYNSAGDAGKLAFTGIFSAAIGIGLAWDLVLVLLSLITLVFALVVWKILAGTGRPAQRSDPASEHTGYGWGISSSSRFSGLAMMVFLDSLVQAVFLTFLAFIMLEKGFSEGIASAAVVIALVGGMAGKFACGRLAARFGDRSTFILLQLLTMVGIGMLVLLSGETVLYLLPFIGLVVQGSSTVTYGSVSEFVSKERQSRGYSLIYTVASLSSVIGPFLGGLLADFAGLEATMWALAAVTGLTLPFSVVLSDSRYFASVS